MISFDFLITSLIIVALPGTGVIYTLALGLGRGMKASIWAALGCTLGIVPHMTASILGLAALLLPREAGAGARAAAAVLPSP